MTARVFCAIDTPDLPKAASLAAELSSTGIHIKLGLEFFVSNGLAGVEAVRGKLSAGTEIFLDLKLHDIPNTVAGAVRSAMQCHPDFLTIHASGGSDMMRVAVEAAAEESAKTGWHAPALLGVTVLTSHEASEMPSLGIVDGIPAQVDRLARLAAQAGLQGLVCSPHEIASLRQDMPHKFLLVVPGIRPADSAKGDQKRVMTPEEASMLGADYLVIGRPITEAADPAAMADKILRSLRAMNV